MEIILEVLEETILILPMLLIMYAFLEYGETKNINIYDKLKKNGPLYGAMLGVIPQCGISIIASIFFLEKKITLGTLISVYIATSDEAIPLLLVHSESYMTTLYLIILKFILAIIFGYLVDYFIHIEYKKKEVNNIEHTHSFWSEVITRTLKIYFFIVIVHILLSYLFEYIGEETLSLILLNQSILQPVVASIFGLIPHCIVSVVLTQLYYNQIVSFASLVAGLMSNAGMGLIVLIQNRVGIRLFLEIIGILLTCAIITGLLLSLV